MIKLAESDKEFLTPYKILHHKDKIQEFLDTGTTVPISIDFDLTNMCNHKCPMCNGSREDDGGDNTHQDLDLFKRTLKELKDMGARSVAFGGGGDASTYPHIVEAIRHAKSLGLDIGMYTNAQKLKEEAMDAIIECLTWLRVSLDADGPRIFQLAHGVPGKVWFEVVENIKTLVRKRRETGSKIMIGACYLIGPKTLPGIYNAAKLSRELGVDYIRIRPYFQKPGDDRTRIELDETMKVLERCKELETDTFQVSYPSYRVEWMEEKNRQRKYKKCYGVNFMLSITPDGNVYPCCHFKNRPGLGLEIGNIKKEPIADIIKRGDRKKMSDGVDFRYCPNPCNFENHNEILWDIKQSGQTAEEYERSRGLKKPEGERIHKNFL